jgi:hypothetical protein
MVSKYTQNLINVVEEEAKVNRSTIMPFIGPDFFIGGETTHGKTQGKNGCGRDMAFSTNHV